MPEIEDIMAKLGNAKYYSSTDMCKGYYGISLSKKSRDCSTFWTPKQELPLESHAIWTENGGSKLHQIA